MKKSFYILLILTIFTFTGSAQEISGDINVSFFKDIDRTSTGVGGFIYPYNLSKSKFSLGFDVGIEFIERFMNEVLPQYVDTSGVENADSVVFTTKEYNDFLIVPIGVVLRYDIGNPENLSNICPSIAVGIGGVVTLRQVSYRQVYDIYDNGYVEYRSYPIEISGDSDTTIDLYIKPRFSLTWQRIYLSYEHYFNTEYMLGSVSIGYVFRL